MHTDALRLSGIAAAHFSREYFQTFIIQNNCERMKGMNLSEKVVLITGSSSGIGRTTAVRFAGEGARVVVNYRVNKKGGEETRDEINEQNAKCLLVQADVSKPEDVDGLFQRTVDHFGTVDVLINIESPRAT